MNAAETLSTGLRPDTQPLVTVVVLTYNHERYIEQAVQSVIAQRTTFPVEILIGEDRSTDGTKEILRRLAAANPGKMKLLLREENLGLSRNLQDCREKASGRYMAILEGDDYWTDSAKLQKLFDAIEVHPEWSMIFHSCRAFHDAGDTPDATLPAPSPNRPLLIQDMLQRNHVPTMSVAMYRQGLMTQPMEWHPELRIGDWALNAIHALHGPIGFLPDLMTSYRIHDGGLWSGLGLVNRWRQYMLLFDCLEANFQGQHASEIEASRSTFIKELQREVDDLKKIERRYLALRLDRIAGVLRWFCITWETARKRVTGR
jgi:glycosyltransferase involved in cell wall biosynthesis